MYAKEIHWRRAYYCNYVIILFPFRNTKVQYLFIYSLFNDDVSNRRIQRVELVDNRNGLE